MQQDRYGSHHGLLRCMTSILTQRALKQDTIMLLQSNVYTAFSLKPCYYSTNIILSQELTKKK